VVPPTGGAPASVPVPVTLTPAAPRVSVLGATGRTGRRVVRDLLEAGFHVSALIRADGRGATGVLQKLQTTHCSQLAVQTGTLANESDCDHAVRACDAVVWVAGVPRSLRGWLCGRGDGQDARACFGGLANHVVPAMARNGVRRLVVVSAPHAARPLSETWWDPDASWVENAERVAFWRGHFEHVAAAELAVRAARPPLDFTFLRPNMLDDDAECSRRRVDARAGAYHHDGPHVPRSALSRFIVDELIKANRFVARDVAVAGVPRLEGEGDEE